MGMLRVGMLSFDELLPLLQFHKPPGCQLMQCIRLGNVPIDQVKRELRLDEAPDHQLMFLMCLSKTNTHQALRTFQLGNPPKHQIMQPMCLNKTHIQQILRALHLGNAPAQQIIRTLQSCMGSLETNRTGLSGSIVKRAQARADISELPLHLYGFESACIVVHAELEFDPGDSQQRVRPTDHWADDAPPADPANLIRQPQATDRHIVASSLR
ncbi:hypothetical protein G6F68_013722 [Rhizopus microsporus]|nr:hypothetical protein G6F68_013722 [Rhizopus microsporus]